jgi:hypothetical protein
VKLRTKERRWLQLTNVALAVVFFETHIIGVPLEKRGRSKDEKKKKKNSFSFLDLFTMESGVEKKFDLFYSANQA